jgi:hypothetical protein
MGLGADLLGRKQSRMGEGKSQIIMVWSLGVARIGEQLVDAETRT